MALAKIKNFLDSGLKSVTQPLDRTVTLEPEIGLRIIHSPNDKTLKVTVIGARHLPQNFGFTRVNSYIVKIKFFPGKDKFETTSKSESWPVWNEEFTISLRKETKIRFGKSKVSEETIDGSKLIIATLYAILEDKPLIGTDKKDTEKKKLDGILKKDNKKNKDTTVNNDASSSQEPKTPNKFLNKFFSKNEDKDDKIPERRKVDHRRTIGATTIPLDLKNFTIKPSKCHADDVSTGDIWKPLRPITSGISGAEERRENKKGQLEMILLQEKSDKKDVSDGKLVLCISKLRCSLQTMHEHESLKGQLYIKMSLIENGRVTKFWKSDRFSPTASMKFSQDKAQIIADNSYEGALNDVSFVVKFVSKNKIGKKTTVGSFVIGPDVGGTYSDQWKQAIVKPGQAITKWQAFE
ncbi:hypothetical protein HCN44_010718 [Aphidius gifuensis]|uniref:C2 domain-containing protein n=1 Tax=Aphidius gifuensis TaxID=684658 RepID=A0A834XSS4_APHGI|nr:uncharacterized protein LOC122855834 [Aphidius gifuensis]XP_044013423.1 uncharacterized protein LOC122855834 [Aphidius gifuensis]KAF7991917.1 hypothetical protein HCN44_010718 [Aphidius gifuensis]